jgi:predicted Zn-dependent peptidase
VGLTATELSNGLPIYRVPLPGTAALTALVAYDAGTRAERERENGIAHFLEHLVFRGGDRYPTHRDINWTSDRLGARLNAYTSHESVAFHVRVRAERALEAVDLLTDVVGRPRIDPEELERERGVVIQEIARTNDQPAQRAQELSSESTFGPGHPLGRSILGTEERIRSFSRDEVVDFRERRWSRGAAFLVGNCDELGSDESVEELFAYLPAGEADSALVPAPPFEPRIKVEQRDSRQSHLVLDYRPAIDVTDQRIRAAFTVYAILLGGSMGSRLVDEIRERRGLAYSLRASADAYSDVGVLEIVAGLDRDSCVVAYRRIREMVAELGANGPDEEEVERARSCAAGRRTLGLENSTVVAREIAEELLVFGDEVEPSELVARLDAVTRDQVAEVAARIGAECAVTCVGPHTAEQFTYQSPSSR